MGIIVQREFTVDRDDRREFERQSRLGTWEGMRYLGSQMIAYGSWALGDSGEAVVTNSAYVDFDHWTATRGWGEFDDELSEPTPVFRALGEPLSALPATFGSQSVVCETSFEAGEGKRSEFIDISTDAIWPWYREQGARLTIVGRDPLRGVDQLISMVAFPSIGHWYRIQGSSDVPTEISVALQRRAAITREQQARVLMVQTAFGDPVE